MWESRVYEGLPAGMAGGIVVRDQRTDCHALEGGVEMADTEVCDYGVQGCRA